MNAGPVYERVRNIIIEHLGVPGTRLTKNANFETDLGADSLNMIELMMAFEQEFDIVIDDDDARKVKTVDDAITFIEKAVGESIA